MKTPEGEVKVAVLGDSPEPEEYLQHISSFIRMLERKKISDDLLKLAKAVTSLKAPVRRLTTAPQGEKPAEKTVRLELLKAARDKLVEASVHEGAKLETVYELFRKTLKEDPELQWDRIVSDMHTKDPWEDLKGAKHDGIRGKSSKSLWECIDFHKRTIYSIDAAEQQRLYILCHLKKPAKSSIRAHVTRMETLNKYIGLLPTIKNSPQAVASTELGNVPFNKTTLTSIILNHLPVAWRTQYAFSHTLVPESPRAILLDLENIEKLFVEKTNEAARLTKAKVATALKGAGEYIPRKGNTELDDEAGHNHCKMSHDHYKSFCRLVLGLYYDTWALHHTERAFRNLIIQDLDMIMHYWDTDIYNMNCKPISYRGDRWDMARTLACLTLLLTGADACTPRIVASVWGED